MAWLLVNMQFWIVPPLQYTPPPFIARPLRMVKPLTFAAKPLIVTHRPDCWPSRIVTLDPLTLARTMTFVMIIGAVRAYIPFVTSTVSPVRAAFTAGCTVSLAVAQLVPVLSSLPVGLTYRMAPRAEISTAEWSMAAESAADSSGTDSLLFMVLEGTDLG